MYCRFAMRLALRERVLRPNAVRRRTKSQAGMPGPNPGNTMADNIGQPCRIKQWRIGFSGFSANRCPEQVSRSQCISGPNAATSQRLWPLALLRRCSGTTQALGLGGPREARPLTPRRKTTQVQERQSLSRGLSHPYDDIRGQNGRCCRSRSCRSWDRTDSRTASPPRPRRAG